MSSKNSNNNISFHGFGLGLRQKHVNQIIREKPKEVNWFEIISENYFEANSQKRSELEKLRQDYPFFMHGVSMSIGSTDAIDVDYLNNLKELEKWLEPEIISDHICWTGINKFNSHDLLPVPYTEESLKNMIMKIQQVQDFLGRKIALENPSTYLEFEGSSINEWDYIRYVAEEADCNLLLDVNNVYVNCYNHNYDPQEYIAAIPAERVVQVHLAGHQNFGTHIVDTHDNYINEQVLDLYHFTTALIGRRNTMIEWDSDIPEFDELLNELKRVKSAATEKTIANDLYNDNKPHENSNIESLADLYNNFQTSLLDLNTKDEPIQKWVKDNKELTPAKQFEVYSNAYRLRLFDSITEEYPASRKYLGNKNFNMLVRTYIEKQPSKYRNMDDYILAFPNFAARFVDEISFELIKLEMEINKIRNKNSQTIYDLNELMSLALKSDFELPTNYKLLKFNNNINKIYRACITDEIASLSAEEISDKPTFILLSVENYEVFRQEITNHQYVKLFQASS